MDLTILWVALIGIAIGFPTGMLIHYLKNKND